MRLLHTRTLRLHSFVDTNVPEYAVLSHTWTGDEVIYEDLTTERRQVSVADVPNSKCGKAKVIASCERASADGYEYIWIDSCCIDKSSSAELSEAINSMFPWYRAAKTCYAFLVDVNATASDDEIEGEFRESRWFTRGWTLQELIAPVEVEFFNKEWENIGTRSSMTALLADITGIDQRVLIRGPGRGDDPHGHFHIENGQDDLRGLLRSISVASRMTWAKGRETTRVEDIAYCLMGIFDINMPLLYGEGQRAFQRLQEEVVKQSDDQSILAWHRVGGDIGQLFATEPKDFESHFDSLPRSKHEQGMTLSHQRLELDVLLCRCTLQEIITHSPFLLLGGTVSSWFAVLNCNSPDDFLARPAFSLDPLALEAGLFQRASATSLVEFRFDKDQYMQVLPVMPGRAPIRVPFQLEESSIRRIKLETRQVSLSSIMTPPLRISLEVNIKQKAYSIKSTVPKRDGMYMPPWPIPFAEGQHINPEKVMCGLIHLSNGSGRDDLFVVWGLARDLSSAPLTDTTRSHHIRAGRAWWDDSIPYCSIIHCGTIGVGPNADAEKFWRDNIDKKKWGESHVEHDMIHSNTKSEAWLTIGAVRLKVNIKPVSFLDRKLFELSIEVNQPLTTKVKFLKKRPTEEKTSPSMWDWKRLHTDE